MLTLGCLALLAVLGTSCEDRGNNRDYHYDPPDGEGVLVVDNQALDDVEVYVDGDQVADVRNGHHEGVNLNPGEYPVVLVHHHGDRQWADYVDILEDRQTILWVADGGNSDSYNVSIRFD